VLDLDHTLLNSTRADELDGAGRAALDAAFRGEAAAVAAAEAVEAQAASEGAAGQPAAPAPPPPLPPTSPIDPRRRQPSAPPPLPPPPLHPHPLRTLFALPGIGLITKLRPGLRSFLAAAHERYELVVYTHGDRAYAHAMARLLDPSGTLFGGRVISQADSTVGHVKSLDVVLGQPDATLILDDTAGVWPAHAANLIQVERYIYFPACAGRFETGRAGLLVEGRDEDAGRGTLAAVGRVLAAVHDRVFSNDVGGGAGGGADGAGAGASDPRRPRLAPKPSDDVRVHLAAERAAVLAGTVLVLSGCAPLRADPAASPVGRAAASLGARIDTAVVAGTTTHVVAALDGTAKAAAGRAAGASVVGPDWVFSALFLWRRADEAAFPPPPLPTPRGGEGAGAAAGDARLPGGARTAAEDLAAAAAAAGGGRRSRSRPPLAAPGDGEDDRIQGVL